MQPVWAITLHTGQHSLGPVFCFLFTSRSRKVHNISTVCAKGLVQENGRLFKCRAAISAV